MLPWELTIRKGENGFVLFWKEELENERYIDRTAVIQDFDDEHDAIFHLCLQIMEHFGYYGDKYGYKQTTIRTEHGHKYDCKGCEICMEE